MSDLLTPFWCRYSRMWQLVSQQEIASSSGHRSCRRRLSFGHTSHQSVLECRDESLAIELAPAKSCSNFRLFFVFFGCQTYIMTISIPVPPQKTCQSRIEVRLIILIQFRHHFKVQGGHFRILGRRTHFGQGIVWKGFGYLEHVHRNTTFLQALLISCAMPSICPYME